MFDIKSFLRRSWKEGTQVDRGNILTAVFIGGPSHLFLYFLYTHIIPLPYDSLTLRLFLVFICISTASYWYLPTKIKDTYFGFYWHLMIISSLNFNATFFLLKNNFNEIYLYWEIFVTFLLTIYVPNWFIFLVDFLIAVSSAILLYFLTTPVVDLTPNFNVVGYSLILLFTAFSGVVFVYANRSAWLAKQDQQYKELISLAGSVVHEIRNPLNAISLTGSNLQDFSKDTTKSNESRLTNMVDSIFYSVKQANDIINIALSDLQNKPINPHDFTYLKPSKILPEIISKYGYSSEKERTKVQFIFGTETNEFVFRAVEGRFTFIIYNLIKNALHYLKEYPNSIVTIGLETRFFKDKEFNVIYVHDTGPGIHKENMSKMFTSFFTVGKKEGTGLGLAFCKRNMQIFGGDIICESELGKWTKFSLLFPKVDQESINQEESQISDINSDDKAKNKPFIAIDKDSGKTKILLVDDEQTNLLITKAMIEKNLNILCELAHSGKEAIEIESHHIEDHKLIITDIQMIDTNGITAAKKIRSFNKNIPIVALTSLEYEDLQKNDHNYFSDHLSKPVSGHILYRTISKFIPDLKDNIDYLGVPDQYLPDIKSKKILIVDDQELNLSIFSKKMQNLGMEVTKATDGKEMVEVYQNSLIEVLAEDAEKIIKSQFDIIVTDVNMPIMSGTDGAKKIREIESSKNISYKNRIPIIALSGDGTEEDIKHFFEAGMSDYFIKGSDVNKLIKIITIYLNPDKSYKSLNHKKEDEDLHHKIANQISHEEDNDQILNQEKIMQFSNEDRHEFLKIFLEGSQTQLNKIKQTISANDNKELSIALHALKGISGNIGAERVFAVVTRTDYNLKNNIAVGENWYEELNTEYEKLKSEISKIL